MGEMACLQPLALQPHTTKAAMLDEPARRALKHSRYAHCYFKIRLTWCKFSSTREQSRKLLDVMHRGDWLKQWSWQGAVYS